MEGKGEGGGGLQSEDDRSLFVHGLDDRQMTLKNWTGKTTSKSCCS
jgi:hypothetical protein